MGKRKVRLAGIGHVDVVGFETEDDGTVVIDVESHAKALLVDTMFGKKLIILRLDAEGNVQVIKKRV